MGFGKDGKGVIIRDDDIITLGTLAGQTVVKQDSPLGILEDFRILKQRHWWNLTGGALVDGDGPLIMGICNDELSVGEIGEVMQAGGPLNRNDRERTEFAERGVHLFPEGKAMIPFLAQTADPTVTYGFFESKHRWTYNNPEGWALFLWNKGAGALTTGGTLRVTSEFYGVWVV